jgi:serine/threonine-protein kinase
MSLETADFLYKLAGGHPFCLQVFCFHAYEFPGQLEEIRQRAMRELQAHFEYYWRNLSRLEQETLLNLPTAIARRTQDTTLAHLLRDLTHKCLLIAKGRGYRYAFQAWADFVRTQRDQEQVAESGLPVGSLSGASLGPYEVQELLARGGMAEVYKGLHVRLGRPVAIKVLPPQLAGEGNFRRRFEQEARAVAALKHPHIVQVFDFGNVNDTYYLVMEYVDGKDLTNYLQEHAGPMPLAEVLPILRNVASALDYAHMQGVVHRDIKPSNILLEMATIIQSNQLPYRAILSDFGIARLLSSSAATTGTGMIGTLDYMAPEQIQSPSTVDSSADIYALGVLAYRMVTGVLPFTGENPGEVLAGHLHRPAPDPRSLAPALPAHSAEALKRAMAKAPDGRFPTASQLVAALAP